MSSMPERTPAPAYVRTPAAPFLNSLSVDRPLVRYDIAGSIAHVQMLGATGVIASADAATIVRGLRAVAHEVADGTFPWRDDLEDVHTNVEARLTELVGPVGGKVHTARSRNDQVAVDERLYLRAAVRNLGDAVATLAGALLDRADRERDLPMPGYTHLQRAQPITVGHWLLAHFWRLERDLDRLLATAHRADVSPLGAGALAGTTLAIDPAQTAERLGFGRTFDNSLDAVSDRDPLAELLFDLALLGVHLSGLGEDLVLFATREFGFVRRTPALGSGSSLMPQKHNPDVAELARGKAGRQIGDLVALLTTLKGLPLAYDRDLQEDKAPVLDAVATASEVLGALTGVVRTLEWVPDRLREVAADPELYATDRAEELVANGTPFRAAHSEVGRSYPADGPSAAPRAFDPSAAVGRRATHGGPAPSAVAVQSADARARLAAHRASLSSLDRKVGRIEELLNEEQR